MNSGIYKLLFPSGKYYIGQTNNFKRRWEEHFDKMRRGKAARNMQAEFNREGFPACDVLFECHVDHLNLLEPYFITGAAGPNMLNSTIPPTGTEDELNILMDNEHALKSSTATMCLALQQMHVENNKLRKELQALKDGTIIPDLELEVSQAYDDIKRYSNEIHYIKNLNLVDRIFKNY